MAQATTVGSLLVSLGMDSTQFQREATKAQSKTAAIAQSFNITGKQVYEASQRMGVSVAGFASAMQSLQNRVNPAAAALDRYRRDAVMLKEAFRNGIITQEQFNTNLRQSIQVYREASRGVQSANDNIKASNGNMQAGMQQLGYQISDVAAMWGSGSKPMQIFASQAGQVTQAIALMTGGAGKFGAFMTGPWGAAITAGVVVLGTLISRLNDASDALDDVRKSAADAMDELRRSTDNVSAMTNALDKNAKSRIDAMAKIAQVNREISQTEKNLDALRRTPGGAETAQAEQSRLSGLYSRRKAAEDQLAQADKNLSEAMTRAEGVRKQEKAVKAAEDREKAGKKKERSEGRKPTGRSAADIAADQAKEVERLGLEELRAKLDLATDADARADLSRELLLAERQKRIAEIDANKEFSADQKAAQKAYIDRLYGVAGKEGEITVSNGLYTQKLSREIAQEQMQLANDMLDRQASALSAWADIEPNTRERARLEREALALQQQIQSNLLEQQIASGQIADAEKARSLLSQQQAAQRQRVDIQNMSPMERYNYNLRSSVANINDAMEGIQVDAMDGLTNGIANAIAGTQKLGDVFKNVAQQIIADLIRIQLQKAIVGGIGNALGGLGGLGGMFGGGGNAFASAGSYDFSSFGNINLAGARANGGPVRAGLPYLVGERGPEIVVPGMGGQVIPNHELSQMGGGGVTNNYYGPGAEEFWGKVQGISSNTATTAVVRERQTGVRKQQRKLGRK